MLNQKMTPEQREIFTNYLRSEMVSTTPISQALAWGALQLAGRMFDQDDVHDCKESAERSIGRKLRRPW